jgi:hypothetical protein
VALNIYSISVTTLVNCQVSHAIRLRPYVRFLIAGFSRSRSIYSLCVARYIRRFDNRAPNPVILPSPQIFAYLTSAASSLLIVLRMYVPFWGSPCEAYVGHQNRHLEQEKDYCCFRDWCMGDQHCIPHSR